jgi:hypothetical protein
MKTRPGYRTVEKGYQLFARSLGTQSQGNGGQPLYSVQSEDHIIVLQASG